MTKYVSDSKRGIPLSLQGKVSRMLETLAKFSFGAEAGPDDSDAAGLEVSEEAVTAIVQEWRERTNYLPGDLLSDPAWGMLLELLQSEIQGCRVSLSRLCKVSGVSNRTAVRWLKALEHQGLAIRRADPQNAHNEFVELSPKGSSALRGYFHHVVQPRRAFGEQH